MAGSTSGQPQFAAAWEETRPITPSWPDEVSISYATVAGWSYLMIVSTWIAGAFLLTRTSGRKLPDALTSWGIFGTLWWCVLDLWEWVWIAAGLLDLQSVVALLSVTPQIWLALCLSGWMATFAFLSALSPLPHAAEAQKSLPQVRRIPAGYWVGLAAGLYLVVFTTMNWRMYFNLLIPHGDSAMYEEHLWNLLHGKGFRSYLDQGLFLGEHIQFVHLFLIPLYALWPSHLTLELLESSALALGAFPVFWMTRRQTGRDAIAIAAAIAYLLYAPMQFLDIEIDLKTFRPEAFGIPLLLLTLDQLERRRMAGFLVGLAFTLTVKEDYAIVFGPLGLWIAFHAWRGTMPGTTTAEPTTKATRTRWTLLGIGLSIGSVAYLWLATRVIMPWFRSGVEIHYAGYFRKFGETPEAIVINMLTNPGLLLGELMAPTSWLYALMMLAPVAFIPLFSPGRLAVAGPLFGILCLNELARDPQHQFHAPLVGLVFWAVAGGLPQAAEFLKWIAVRMGRRTPMIEQAILVVPRTLLWSSALTTGLFLGLSPLGVRFWDTGSSWNWPCWNWRMLYGSNPRTEKFARILPLIPRSSRVASTDFIHPRFTHHERSYDYSGYRRKVSNFEERVPEDTDFIVIDTRHPYSTMKRPADVPEYRDHPDQWELLPDETDGFFIVLKRRRER